MQHTIPIRVAVVIYDNVNAVDVFGPMQVFESVNHAMRISNPEQPIAYETQLVSLNQAQDQTEVRLSTQTRIVADSLLHELGDMQADTLIIPGGQSVSNIIDHQPTIDWLLPAIHQTRRVASICSGALILAKTGELDQRNATTHWGRYQEFAERYPEVKLNIDALFTQDGKYYCSAGVTAGIDLALHLVQEDYGRTVALEAAREMVVFYNRPGGQNQFSSTNTMGRAKTEAIIKSQQWIQAYCHKSIDVSLLADKAAMSVRNFSRKFTQEVGLSPSRYIARVRLNKARVLLEDTKQSISQIATQCGYQNGEILRRLFIRELNVSPSHYRKRFQVNA